MVLSNKDMEKTRLRYNMLTMLVYIVGLILLVQLFNLQIVNGKLEETMPDYLIKAYNFLPRFKTV